MEKKQNPTNLFQNFQTMLICTHARYTHLPFECFCMCVNDQIRSISTFPDEFFFLTIFLLDWYIVCLFKTVMLYFTLHPRQQMNRRNLV